MYYNGVGSIYDPSKYPDGVPNPYAPRVHAWGGGPWPSEGTRYHGPIYTRPMWGHQGQKRPMNGLGSTQRKRETMVNTRGGVFAPDGYGGGVFNGNVAFGAIDSNAQSLGPAPLQHPLAGGQWGAIPWVCWGGASGLPENTAFKACIAGIQARMPGKSLSDPQILAAAQQECSQHCNQLAAEQQVYAGTYSADTANMQSRINAHIHASRAQDPTFPYCPVDVDGKLGKQTCTASKLLFGQWPDLCDSIGFNSPWANEDCSGGHDVPPQPPTQFPTQPTEPPEPTLTPSQVPQRFSQASMIVGGIAAAAIIGGIAWYGNEAGWFSG